MKKFWCLLAISVPGFGFCALALILKHWVISGGLAAWLVFALILMMYATDG
jgi:hypothetical protein